MIACGTRGRASRRVPRYGQQEPITERKDRRSLLRSKITPHSFSIRCFCHSADMDNAPSSTCDRLLPAEIWISILERVALQDISNVRLVNSALRDHATPLRFRALSFTFNHSSIRNLHQISSKRNLRRHVRYLDALEILLPHHFCNYDAWEQSVSLPGDPQREDDVYPSDNDQAMMPYEEWARLSDEEKQALFQAYEEYRVAIEDEFRQQKGHAQLSDLLTGAISDLSQLATFVHTPTSLLSERWVVRWQRLRIDTCYDEHDSRMTVCAEAEDAGALHLSYVLRALSQAKRSLTSLTLQFEGPAIWGAHRLGRLWASKSHEEIRYLREPYLDAAEADVEASGSFGETVTVYETQLSDLATVFEDLTHLHCCVFEANMFGSLLTASEPLANILSRANMLTKLHLAFGHSEDGTFEPTLMLEEYDGQGVALLGRLADCNPWPCLRELKLQIATDVPTLLRFLASLSATLRLLVLSNVTLTPQGVNPREGHHTYGVESAETVWTFALPSIAQNLPNLEDLQLFSLHVCQNQGVVTPGLFDWHTLQSNDYVCACFDRYRRSIVDGLLLEKQLPHSLGLADFLKTHCHH
jgi:hypothetical protein